MNIRPASNSDSPAIKAMVFTVLAEYGLKPCPCSIDADLDDIDEHYHRRGGSFHVIDSPEDGIIGSVGIYHVSSDVCELRKMYLSKAHRGKGLGKKLLEHGLAEARRLGYRRMVLETASVLKEAIQLYRQYGFQPCHPERMVARCDQAYCLELT